MILNKVLFFGPMPPPFHGQSIAFSEYYTSAKGQNKILIDTNLTGATIFNKVLLTIMYFLKIPALILFKKPTVIYFTCSRSVLGSFKDVWLIFLSILTSTPIVCHLHGADFKEFYQPLSLPYKSIVGFLYKRLTSVIVLTPGMIEQFEMFPGMNIHTVSNFYNTSDISIREKPKNKPGSLNFLYLSNIMETKGIIDLLDAFDEVVSTYPKAKLLIAGGFVSDIKLSKSKMRKKFFQRLSVEKNIEYFGIVSGVEKKELLFRANVLVLPSYYASEAVPLCIIEGMASGCAILTTKHNYLPDIVNSKIGELVNPQSVNELASSMNGFIEDNEKVTAMGNYNKELAKNIYSKKTYVKAIDAILIDAST